MRLPQRYLLLALLHPRRLLAAESLADRIDAQIAAGHAHYADAAAPLAPDDEFLRRATLDLIGRVPTATEARAFFADRSPFKRVRLIDSLLADPDCSSSLGPIPGRGLARSPPGPEGPAAGVGGVPADVV